MYSTISAFQKRLLEITQNYSDKAGYIVTRWSQGRHLELPLGEVEALLVKPAEIRKIVDRAVSRLLEFFSYPYDGVEIFAISSPQRTYGTGKSQVAVFIAKELEARGVKTRFLSYASKAHPKKPISPGIFKAQLLSGVLDSRLVVFIDELDLLVSPELAPEEQVKAIEGFANALIEYTETPPRKGIKHAIVPVLSYKIEEEIRHIARDRLGRRLLNVIARVSIDLDASDIYRIFETSVILASMYEGLITPHRMPDLQLVTLLYNFAKDYAEHLWPPEEVAGLPIGTAVAKAMSLSRLYAQGLSEEIPSSVSLGDPAKLGRLCESSLREVLKKLLPRYTVKIRFQDEEYTVTWLLESSPSKVGHGRADMCYLARIGALNIGSLVVEITAEKTLSKHKLEQILGYSLQSPVVLIHLFTGEKEKRDMAENIESLAPPNPVELIQVPLQVFKYPAILGKAGEELAYTVAEELFLAESLKAILGRTAGILFNRWMAANKAQEATASSSEEEAREKLATAALGAARSFVSSLAFTGPNRKKRRTLRKMVALLSGALSTLMPTEKLPRETVREVMKDILSRWSSKGLGKFTGKTFTPGEHWSDEEAAEIVARTILEILNDVLAHDRSPKPV